MLYLVLSESLQVQLTTERPLVHCWKHEVSFRSPHYAGEKRLGLASQVSQTPIPYTPPSSPLAYSVPVLKSNLQKAVRRGLAPIAVATAAQLLRQGEVTELLRRLPIILLEDTLAHPVILPRWTWWLLANSRGYTLSESETLQLLADVEYIADATQTPYRDRRVKQEAEVDVGNIGKLEGSQQVTAFCIWIRSQWGGMTGDMAWLRHMCETWCARDADVWSSIPNTSPPPLTAFPQVMGSDDMLLEAVDFHVCGRMLPELAKKYEVNEREIQEAIWWWRSEPNVRQWFAEGEEERAEEGRNKSKALFERIRKAVDTYASASWKPQKPAIKQGTIFQFLKNV